MEYKLEAPLSSATTTSTEGALVTGFVDKCITKVLTLGLEELAMQGGLIYTDQGGMNEPFPLGERTENWIEYEGYQVKYAIYPPNRNIYANLKKNISADKYEENYTILFLDFDTASSDGRDGEKANYTVNPKFTTGRYGTGINFTDSTHYLMYSSGIGLDENTLILCKFEDTLVCAGANGTTVKSIKPANFSEVYHWFEGETMIKSNPQGYPPFEGPINVSGYVEDSGDLASDRFAFAPTAASWNLSGNITGTAAYNLWVRFGGSWLEEEGNPATQVRTEREVVIDHYVLLNRGDKFTPLPVWRWNLVGQVPFHGDQNHELSIKKQGSTVSGIDVMLLTLNTAYDPSVCPAAWDYTPDICDTENADFDPPFVDAKYGRGIQANSAKRYAVYPTLQSINIEEGTIQMWIRPNWNFGVLEEKYFFDMGFNDSGSNRFSLYYGNPLGGKGTQLVFNIHDSDPTSPFNEYAISAPVFWTAGDWVYVAVTWENISSGSTNAEMHLHIDGREVGTPITNSQITVEVKPSLMFLGQSFMSQTLDNSSDAVFDDFKISDRALTSSEITKSSRGNFNIEEGSISFWIYPYWDGNDNLDHTIFQGINGGMETSLKKDSLNRLIMEVEGVTEYFDVDTWAAESWNKIEVSWNATQIALMLSNGSSRTAPRASVQPWNTDIVIGRNPDGTEGCECKIDDFVVRNYAMSFDKFYSNESKQWYNYTPKDYPWWYEANYFPYRIPFPIPDFFGYYGDSHLVPLTNDTDPNYDDKNYSIESQLKHKLENNTHGVFACLNWSEFRKMGYAVDPGNYSSLNFTIVITDDKVTANMDYEVIIKKNISGITLINATGPEMKLDRFSGAVSVRLGKIYKYLTELIEDDTRDIAFNINQTVVGSIVSNVSLNVDLTYDDIILVKDLDSNIKGHPFEFRFARHNRNPGLFYMDPLMVLSILAGTDNTQDLLVLGAIDPDEDTCYFNTTPVMPGVSGDIFNVSVNDSFETLGPNRMPLGDWQEFIIP